MQIGPGDPSLTHLGQVRPKSEVQGRTLEKVESTATTTVSQPFLREVQDDVESLRDSEYREQSQAIQREIEGTFEGAAEGRFLEFCRAVAIDPKGQIATNVKKLVFSLEGELEVLDQLQIVGIQEGPDPLNQICTHCLKTINAGFLQGDESKRSRLLAVRRVLDEVSPTPEGNALDWVRARLQEAFETETGL